MEMEGLGELCAAVSHHPSKKRGVPRGPPEWGELLYEPEWAGERRWEDTLGIAFPAGIVLIASVLSALWSGDPLCGE